ncbi:MAG: DUF1566 domain-containing protein [Methylomonas sp.]|jgi:hypothetical protein
MQNRKILLAAGALFSLTTINAQATVDAQTQANLTVTNGGLTVSDSVTSTTWTSNANLLGTLESTTPNLVQTIIHDDPVITDTANIYDTPPNSGTYNLTTSDFGANGQVDWWGAQAFVHYLNIIDYAGITTWQLPPTFDGSASVGYDKTNSLLGELFNGELGASVHGNGAYFTNIQSASYWSSTEASYNYGYAWTLNTSTDLQGYYNDFKYLNDYVWPVSSNSPIICTPTSCQPIPIQGVPEPEMFWLMLTGFGLLGIKRRIGLA